MKTPTIDLVLVNNVEAEYPATLGLLSQRVKTLLILQILTMMM
jgi:hypothetical protein